MKKHGLLKIIGAILLLVMVASFALNGRSEVKDYIGFGDLMFNGAQSLYYFFYIAIFVLSIGGFYGVLNKATGYKNF